jgi:lipopolysaccharide export LptBFGC system permease protein LptF
MPGILFRMILGDLLRVLVATTSVLVTVIAFGAAVKPLAQGLLGPEDLLRYSLLATVPMLQFALPFSAAFAGVVVFHRMANDLELVAMSASGISWRRILAAPLVLGAVLTVVMAVVVDVGVPTFWLAMKRMVADDLTRLFVTQVERGEAIAVGDTQIYADSAVRVDPPEGSGAIERLVLGGVAAIQFQDGEPIREFTARAATVDFYREGEDGYLKLVLGDATILNRGDRALAGSRIVRPEAIELERTLQTGTKGLRLAELLELAGRPEDNYPVRIRRQALIDVLAGVDLGRCLADSASGRGSVTLSGGGNERWIIENARFDGDRIVPRSGAEITVRPGGRDGKTRLTAAGASIETTGGGRGEPIRIDLVIPEARIVGEGGPSAPRPVRVPGLAVESCPPADRGGLDLAALLADADATAAASGADGGENVAAHAADVRDWVRRTHDEIRARIVQRAAQSLTAIAMLLAGVTFAIWLRGALPLTVYFATFIPSIAAILLVSSGEQVLKGGAGPWGVALAFSGVAGLLAASAFAWTRFARN